MSDKLLPVIIFITIYTKSSYSLPNRDKNNYINRNVNFHNSDLWRNNYKTINNNSDKKIEQNATTQFWRNVNSAIRKNNLIVNSSNGRSLSQNLNNPKTKPRGFMDGLLDFITGGFLQNFLEEKTKKVKTKRRRNKRTKKPTYNNNYYYSAEDDFDFDPIGSFFDGLDNMFYKKEIIKPVKQVSNQKYTPPKISQSTESYADVSSSTEDSDYSTEYSQEDASTEYSNEIQSTTYSDQEDDYQSTNDYDGDESDDKTYLGSIPVTTQKIVSSTESKVTYYNTPQSFATVTSTNKRKPIKPKTTKPRTTTTSTTTTTTTERPPQRPRIPKPIRKTTRKPIQTTSTRPVTIYKKVSRRPHQAIRHKSYTRPEYNLKTVMDKQNCNTSASPTTTTAQSSWLPNIFNSELWSDREPSVTPNPSSSTTKAPGGWLDIFGEDDDPDYPEGQVQKPTTGGWFSNIFDDDETTTISTPIQPPTAATNPPQSSWFNTLLNAEEDDGAYIHINNGSHKMKKESKKSYEGYQLLRVTTRGRSGVKSLLSMQEEMESPGIMWWSTPSMKRPTDLLVSSEMLQEVKDHLDGDDMKYQVLIQDLQKAISFENPKLSKTQRLDLERQRGHPLTWKRYHRYADILRYMEFLSLKYPEMVTLIPLGRSSEGLPLIVAKVSYPDQSNANKATVHDYEKWKLKTNKKPAVWIDAGMNAREWITPAVATWFLHALVEGETGQGVDLDILKLADWYIMPVGNPDGYEYSHKKDRLWSKTRSKHPPDENSLQNWLPWNWVDPNCIGVDPNRNWDYHWNEVGGSDNPCNDFYAGPYAFSEPETRVISTFLMENRDRIKLYLTLQSYSQMWLLPMTHSAVSFIDEIDVMEMGKLALRVLSDTSGTKYDIGTTADVLQPLSGTPFDWVKGIAGIKYAYGVKLRDSKGPHGYLLPGSEIIPTAREIWEAIKVMAFNLN